MNQLEVLIALGIFFVVFLIVVIIILMFAIRENRVERQEQNMKMNVIIDNLIDIVTTNKYGSDEEE